VNLSLLVLLSLACSGDKPIGGDSGDGGADGGGDGGTAVACTQDSQCQAWEICEPDQCVDGDRNNSVEEAVSMLWDDSVQGHINPVGDSDFYAITAAGGEYLRVNTQHDFADGDTVLTLRDPLGKVLAFSDNYPTGGSVSSYDTVLYAWLPTAGTYTIEVEDKGSYSGTGGVGDPAFLYTLSLAAWSQHTSETDAQSNPSVTLSPDGARTLYAVGVVLESDGDSDWIRIATPLSDGALRIFGMVDMGGSEADVLVRIYDDGGQLLSERSNVGPGGQAYYPLAQAGSYDIEVTDAGGHGGDTFWTYVFAYLDDASSAYPVEDEPNDSSSSAQALDMRESTTSGGSTYAYANGTGFIDSVGDADWYQVSARAGAELAVCLNAGLGGSLVTPDLELYDSSGTLVDQSSGDPLVVPNARIEGVSMGSQPYYLRIATPLGGATGSGAWYRFVLYTADFDIASYTDGGYTCPG